MLVTEDVTFTASDGMMLRGTLSNPCGGDRPPVVVLAHQLCETRAEWGNTSYDWVGALNARQIATFAIDLRGHGASKMFADGANIDLCRDAQRPALQVRFAGMVDDVKAAVDYAQGALQAPSVAIVGASIGANSAVVAFADDVDVRMVVALSPGLDYRSIRAEPAIGAIGGRLALLEAAEDDQRSADAVRRLKSVNPTIMTQIFTTGGHGNRMMQAHPDELARIIDLIATSL